MVFVRILLFEIILIVGGHDLNADGANGNIFVDQHPVGRIAADIGFDTPGGQPAVRSQFIAGDGIIAGDAQTLWQGEFQQRVLVKGKVMDLDVVQILLPVGPVGPLSDFGR